MTIQLMLEGAKRAKRFVRETDTLLDIQAFAYGEGVVVDISPSPELREELRLVITLSEEGFKTIKHTHMWGCRYELQASNSANPLLDMMNDYHVWRQSQPAKTTTEQ